MSSGKEAKAVDIKVPSNDPDENEDPQKKREAGDVDLAKEGLKKLEEDSRKHETKDDKDDMTPEDKALKERLELLVERLTEENTTTEIRMNALNGLRDEIRTSTSSMTSVPKPLKFLRPHYDKLKRFYGAVVAGTALKPALAHVLSVLAMTMGKEDERESLRFVLDARQLGSTDELGSFGHEYARHVSAEISAEWHKRTNADAPTSVDDLYALVTEIVPFHVKHHAETDAVDLLLEVDRLKDITALVNADNYSRLCFYIIACSDFTVDQEERNNMLQIAFDGFFEVKQFPDALRVALKLDDRDLQTKCFGAATDDAQRKQLALIMGSHRAVLPGFEDDTTIMEIMGNCHLSSQYAALARDLDVQEAKTPEDIYKTHLAEGGSVQLRKRGGPQKVDSAKQNLASTFVNAFVNAGFGKDLLLTPENSDWLYKNKDHGMMSAAASLGMILLWDLETGFSAIDKYSFSNQDFVKAGALLATGMISTGVTNPEMDAALALLSEHVESDKPTIKTAAIMGLGLAYAGTGRQEVLELLTPQLVDSSQTIEVCALSCLSIGLVFTGTAHQDVLSTMVETFMDRASNPADLKDPIARLMCVGVGLVLLGKGEACQPTLAAIEVIEAPIKKYLALTVQTCAYAGTGSVLQVQPLLQACADHLEEEEKNMHQAVAVLGVALITMGEDLGAQMAIRSFDHLLQYGEVNIRRAIPLALSLLSVSYPDLNIMDTLSKLSHDTDEEVSQNACLALGFLGAGTNNARIAGMLRQLASYYAKEPNHLFLVRIAQGLLHMGKGLMTLNPFHSDKLLMSKVAMAGLVATMHACLDMKNGILNKRPHLLYLLVPTVRPRMLVTVDEDLKSVPVKVRVGQAVDTVGQAGKPKKITGFQSHTTPVLLSGNEKAEFATDEYLPLTNVLEGFVIVKKNPDYTPEPAA